MVTFEFSFNDDTIDKWLFVIFETSSRSVATQWLVTEYMIRRVPKKPLVLPIGRVREQVARARNLSECQTKVTYNSVPYSHHVHPCKG